MEDGTSITATEFTAWVTGATAGGRNLCISQNLSSKIKPSSSLSLKKSKK